MKNNFAARIAYADLHNRLFSGAAGMGKAQG